MKVTVEIRHWPEHKHFRAIDEDGGRFVYCPVGLICSWNVADYENRWCEFCTRFFGVEGAGS